MKRSTFTLGIAVMFFATPALADETSAAIASSNEFEAALAATDTKDSEPTVMLHVKSPDGVVAIEREDNGELVCTSPCDKPVPAAVRYRIGGSRPSRAFVLDAHGGTAKISVDAASKRGLWAGIAGLGVGGALLGSGIVALALGYASQGPVPGSDGTVTDTTYSNTMMLGSTFVLAGITAGIWGGATLVSNWRATVSGNVVKDPPARGSDTPATRTALRTAGPTTPAVFVPILGGTF